MAKDVERGRHIKKLREETLKLSQKEFGKHLGVTQATVSSWEDGDKKRAPSEGAYFRLGTLAVDPNDKIWFWKRAGLNEQSIATAARQIRKEQSAPPAEGQTYQISRFRETLRGREVAGPPIPLPAEFIPNPDSTVCLVVDQKRTPVEGPGSPDFIVDSPRAVFILDQSERDAPNLLPFHGQVVFARYTPGAVNPGVHSVPGLYMGRLQIYLFNQPGPDWEFRGTAELTLLDRPAQKPAHIIGRFRHSAKNELPGLDPFDPGIAMDPRVNAARGKARSLSLTETKLAPGWKILGRVLGRLKVERLRNE